jgi:Protein of unknown function (DUF2630)/Antibiotic biosynthesis monooxygenase
LRWVAEEHDLRTREQVERDDDDALGADRGRLSEVAVEPDRCWGLLRQRRALRGAGADPDDASARDAGTVETLPPVIDMPVIGIAEISGSAAGATICWRFSPGPSSNVRGAARARRYVFAARLGTPDQYVLLSEWETRDAMDAYHRSEHFAR